MAETIEFIIEKLNQKDVRLKSLLKQILGIKTEKSKKVIPQNSQAEDSSVPSPQEDVTREPENPKKKRKGHGRNGSGAYTGAKHIFIPHQTLKHRDPCPKCLEGKVYREKKPGTFTFIEGKAPIQATVYRPEKLRCNLCGAIFQADLPETVPQDSRCTKHFDESAKSMIAVLRYGHGLPLNRLSKLQSNLGIPLPASTAWDKSEAAADKIYRVFEELKRQSAQGDIIHNDDTGMKILAVMKEIETEIKEANGKKSRTGIFTTGIVSVAGDKKIALFFTGRKHAGENFSDLLEHREADRSPPIQMCDAKKGNAKESADVIVSNCNVHARRYFVDVAEDFPDQCTYVLVKVYKEIYKNDAIAKERNMSPAERLKFHQEKSGPIMDAFYEWLNKQFDKRLVEPNSSLGKAISYVLNHWPELTQFLHVPGAVLDNNICEQSLKMSICHRKNSLFYKTLHGAYIGDLFMSLIHTCELNNANPFDYITQLQRHSSEVFKNPSKWLPWNYQDTLAAIRHEREHMNANLELAATAQ